MEQEELLCQYLALFNRLVREMKQDTVGYLSVLTREAERENFERMVHVG